MIRVLNVAEKNDAAKGIADILSRGGYQRRNGRSVYNKLYEFNYNIFGRDARMVVTSVSGHLFNYDFTGQARNWQLVPPVALFEAPIVKQVYGDNGPNLVGQLETEAAIAQYLVIWTDGDREGENIGYEIINVCTRRNPRLEVYRAKFSEITLRSITRAIQNLVRPDHRISEAVDCRQELDLRIGASFTRFQTLRLQRVFPAHLAKNIISYGSCQFPTLGFVVERYKARLNFVEEPFWKLVLKHSKMSDDDQKAERMTTEFSWRRIRLFDQEICNVYLQKCLEKSTAVVENVTTKPKSRWRPLPLDTVELEKTASRRLRMTAKQTMSAAEKLYTRGFISYPRTETNIFPKELDLRPLVEAFVPDHQYGAFAQDVLQRGINPRNGTKTDQAHPPIHPTRYATPGELQGHEKSVYEFVVRRFLACVSRDAKGFETVVDVDVNGEKFYASGLMITDRGYLEIYHQYEQWTDKNMPRYETNETFTPDSITAVEGRTSAPALLTEADLIALMEKHGIGTDATHAEHIEKIKDRLYADLNTERRFIPGHLGLGLVDGYDSMGYPMSKPKLRAELETALKEICNGVTTKDDVLRIQLAKYKEILERATAEAVRLDDAIGNYIGQHNKRPPPPPPGGGGGGGDDDDDSPPRRRRRLSPLGGDRDPDQYSTAAINCECGVEAKLFKVRKEGVNQGREFYTCSQKQRDGGGGGCKFFLWADGLGNNFNANANGPVASTSGSVAPRQTNWNGNRNGTLYRTEEERLDDAIGNYIGQHGGGGGRGPDQHSTSSVNCECGVEAKLLKVRKEGVNRGREFYTCSQKMLDGGGGGCKFFLWAADGSGNNANGPTASSNEFDAPRQTNWNRNGNGNGNGNQPFKKQPYRKSYKKKNDVGSPRSNARFLDMFPAPIVSGIPFRFGESGKRRGENVNYGGKKKKPFKSEFRNSQDGGVGGGSGGGQRKCGFCHQPGHTVKTCPQKFRD